MKRVTLLTLTIIITGCTPLTTGKSVYFTKNSERIKGCKFLGNVKSKNLPLVGGPGGRNMIENDIKNKAGAKGGNVLFLSTDHYAYEGSRMSGEVYKCNK